jgi:16S rRNA (cytosine967-C5)-methyltransferase
LTDNSEPEGLAARSAATQKLRSVLNSEQFTPIGATELADSRDRAFANRLVTLALRRAGHLNEIIAQLLERGLPKRSGSFEAVLRLGLAELLFLDDGAAHSAVFLAVEMVKRDKRAMHLAKLMNGVLRKAQREAPQFQALPMEKLFPNWLVKRWTETYGAAAVQDFGAALLGGAPLDLTLRDEHSGLAAELGAVRLEQDSFRLESRDSVISALPGYAEGQFWVQDAASAIPARMMGLAAGARVLDMCAAPGGKTAQLIKAGYQVTALDNSENRMARLRENLRRLGYSADLLVEDGTSFAPDEKFDGVLVDAPCTATGTFRRHPELVWQRQEKDITSRILLQKKLLEQAVKCLNPDGVLVYATCSLEPEEGEAQADWLTQSMSGVRPYPIDPEEAGLYAPGLDEKGRIRVYPGFSKLPVSGELDGFFVARFRVEA